MTEIFKILEFIGTVAFSVSGALVAIGASLDLFGVVFVACITSVGGGILRDVLLGINPPAVFSNLSVILLSALTGVAVFIVAYVRRKSFNILRQRIEHVNNFFDAIGLAAFTVLGSEVGYINGHDDNVFIIVLIGMTTGIGGGIFRDIITDTTPFVFKKHVYAMASLVGGLVYFILRELFGNTFPVSIISMLIVVVMRMLAAKFRWSLPKIKIENDAE